MLLSHCSALRLYKPLAVLKLISCTDFLHSFYNEFHLLSLTPFVSSFWFFSCFIFFAADCASGRRAALRSCFLAAMLFFNNAPDAWSDTLWANKMAVQGGSHQEEFLCSHPWFTTLQSSCHSFLQCMKMAPNMLDLVRFLFVPKWMQIPKQNIASPIFVLSLPYLWAAYTV